MKWFLVRVVAPITIFLTVVLIGTRIWWRTLVLAEDRVRLSGKPVAVTVYKWNGYIVVDAAEEIGGGGVVQKLAPLPDDPNPSVEIRPAQGRRAIQVTVGGSTYDVFLPEIGIGVR